MSGIRTVEGDEDSKGWTERWETETQDAFMEEASGSSPLSPSGEIRLYRLTNTCVSTTNLSFRENRIKCSILLHLGMRAETKPK